MRVDSRAFHPRRLRKGSSSAPRCSYFQSSWSLTNHGPLPPPSLAAGLAVLALAILCTSIAYLLYFHVIKTSGASNASLVTLLIPISGVILGAFVLHEPIHLEQIAGMALIICGLLVIDGRLFQRQSRIP